MDKADTPIEAEEPKTKFFDLAEFIKEYSQGLEAVAKAQRQQIKQQILPLIHNNEELQRLDVAVLDGDQKLVHLRHRTEEVVRFELRRLDLGKGSTSYELELLVKEILDEALGLGPLEDLLADPSVDEIMVNKPDRIFVERLGNVVPTDRKFASEKQLYNVIERIVAPTGRRVDESTPFVDARLTRDGSRVHIIIPPLALNGPTITIRKFSKEPFTYERLVAKQSISRQACCFLDLCVRGKKSIIVSGGTGSGKTTLLNALSNSIPNSERIITIEDAAELRLSKIDLVTLEARKANVEGKGDIPIRELVRNALRMRPDRIVVGECRGAEAFDMLQAMNTGHEGSLTTIHANTPADMLTRLENLVLMATEMPIGVIRANIASAIHLIVQIGRYRDGSRKISRITEMTGITEGAICLKDIYCFEQTGLDKEGKVTGRLRATGYVPSFMDELRVKGFAAHNDLFDAKAPETVFDGVSPFTENEDWADEYQRRPALPRKSQPEQENRTGGDPTGTVSRTT